MNKLVGILKETLYAAAFLFVFSFACINSISNASAATKSFAQLESDYPDGSSFTKSYKGKAWQCHSFACTVGEAYTGSDPYTWSKKYNLNSLKPGDIIRCSRPHSIIVTSVSGNTITYADSNWVGKNIVKWNQTITRSRVTGKFGSLSYVMSAPHVGYTASGSNQEKPSITNVGIESIDYSHVKFHFTAGNSGLVRIVARSRNTGKSATRDYTSGLGHVTAEFNISEFPGTTEMEILIYAYTGMNGGNETLHRLTYGNTVGVVQLPEGNGTIAGFCFDYIYYADHNPDLKEKYGYNEQKLRGHWLTFGIAEGRAGSPVWDGKYYLQANQDVAALCQGNYTIAYRHFLTYGYQEMRASSAFYNGNDYKNKYRSELSSYDGLNLLVHFTRDGLREGRQANDSKYTGNSAWLGDPEIAALCFDHIYYADHNSDLKAAYGYDREKLYNHWIQFGLAEGRKASPVFDVRHYLQKNPDVANAFQNDYTMAYKHFISSGYKELRQSSEYYSGSYYRKKYPGELGAFNGKQLLLHFCHYGLREKRQANTSIYTGKTGWN